MTAKHVFTVFTPTYNRAHTLARVWESLRVQTFRDFEWLVIDDSSTDDTAALVEGWRKQSDFPVRFYTQREKGMHIGFNMGVRLAHGELFLPLDSDDACVPGALERLLWNWNQIPADKRDGFSAVTCLCRDQHGNPIGDKFPEDILDSDSIEIKYRWDIKGEKWGFHRTAALKEFPFPEISGVRAIPQGVVWSMMAAKYRTRFINEYLRIYWTDPPVQQGEQLCFGYPASKLGPSHALWHKTILNGELGWFGHAPLAFAMSAANFARFSFHTGEGLCKQWAQLRPAARMLWITCLPAGVAAYWRDLSRERRTGKVS
jgi:glycosyltransferase involved in cell wall biosynthesis